MGFSSCLGTFWERLQVLRGMSQWWGRILAYWLIALGWQGVIRSCRYNGSGWKGRGALYYMMRREDTSHVCIKIRRFGAMPGVGVHFSRGES